MNFFKRKCFFVSALAVIFALSNRLDAEQWQARHNMTPAQFQSTFDELFKQGYRLVHISGYETAGQERFAAIFDKSGGPAWQARHHMSGADFQKAFDDFSKQGFRLKEVSGYNVGGQDMYAAIWEKNS